MIPGDLLSAFPHRQFHTLPGLLDSWAALPNSNPNACVPMQGGSLYYFYDGLWYDPAKRRSKHSDRGVGMSVHPKCPLYKLILLIMWPARSLPDRFLSVEALKIFVSIPMEQNYLDHNQYHDLDSDLDCEILSRVNMQSG